MQCNAKRCGVTRSGFQRTAGAGCWSKWRVFGIIRRPTQRLRGEASIFSVTLAPTLSRAQTAQAALLPYPEPNFTSISFTFPFDSLGHCDGTTTLQCSVTVCTRGARPYGYVSLSFNPWPTIVPVLPPANKRPGKLRQSQKS